MQNPSTFKVYNASAGSGKTFTLVKEYLKILLESSDSKRFQSILAITFTNKAAAEMKERVIDNLREFSSKEIIENKTPMFLLLEEEMHITDEILHSRSSKVLQNILNNYSSFNITTIDSFTYRLIRSFAFDLGLSMNFDVEMDTKSLLNEAVDLLISRIGEDIELTKVLLDFSIQKTNEDKSWDISRELKEIAHILLNENDHSYVKQLRDKSLSEFIELKEKLKERVVSIENRLKETGEKGMQLIRDFDLEDNDFYRSMIPNHFKNLSSNFKKAKFFDQSTLKERIEERNFYAKSKSEEIKTSIESIINPLLELYTQSENLYKEHIRYKLFLGSLIPLAVLSKIDEALEEVKEDKNIHLNAEFNKIISEHLREQPAALIYEKIGERYKYYFIDEMQDTSKLQWSNLIPLIANSLSQENAKLMLLGDAKQSIYRWRGGEAEQFIDLSNNENPFFIEKERHFLDTNRRSFSEIVTFNNDLFQFISRYFNNDDYREIYFNENVQKTTSKEGGYVNLSFLEEGLTTEEKKEHYLQNVLEIIIDLKNDFNLNEICVITRKRSQGVAIANYLTENNIEIISSETLLLQNSEKVQFIISLLTFLEQKSNKEAKLNTLIFLYEHLKIKEDQHTFFSDFIDLDILSFFNGLNAKGASFNYLEFTISPFYESIETIVRGFRLVIGSDSHVQFFLDEVLQYTIKKSEGKQGFLTYWEEKKDKLSIVVPEEKNAVRIMTIHKSKGLEFPVVIFPYDLDIYRELNPKTWYPIEDKKEFKNFDNLLVSSSKNLEYTGKMGADLYLERKNQLELDNINLLYVTLTRAVEQLYILTERKKESDTPKHYSQFMTEYLKHSGFYDEGKLEYEFGLKTRISEKKQPTENSLELQHFISNSWKENNINIVTNTSLLWDTPKGEAIQYGNLIHEILSKIKTYLDVHDTIDTYLNAGIISLEESKSVESIIVKIVTHERLKQYYTNDFSIYNEREILTSFKEVVKPDRFVVKNNKAIIIDYKTGKPDKKYIQQLALYEDALKEVGFKVLKKILVYIGDEIVIEEV